MKATWKPFKQMIGYQTVPLEPGQFIFGRKKAAQELGLSEKIVRTCLDTLEKAENVTIKRTNKFSIITIVNWDTYQPDADEIGQQTGQQKAFKGPTEGQQGATNKKLKKVKKRERLSGISPDDVPQSSALPVSPDGERERIPYQEIVGYLNEKTGKKFFPQSDKTRRLIDARWEAGFRLADFRRVIDTKAAQWMAKPEMVGYLRPETLFGTKFESYLNEGYAAAAPIAKPGKTITLQTFL